MKIRFNGRRKTGTLKRLSAPKLEASSGSKIAVRSHSQEWLFIQTKMNCLAKVEEKIKC